MLELPVVCILQIFYYSLSKDVLKHLQYVCKDWYEAGNTSYYWRDVSVKTLRNKQLQGFITSHGKHFQNLLIESVRLSRNATYEMMFHCKQLKKLSLTHTYSNSLIDDKFCFLISKIKTLENLQFPVKTTFGNYGLRKLCSLENLNTLELQRNNKIDDFKPIKKMEKLKNLNLSGCLNINNDFCTEIKNLSLEHLNLSYCFRLNINGLEGFFKESKFDLKSFQVNGLNLTSDFIENILAKKATNLERLTLSSLAITDGTYKAVKSLRHLKDLSIIGCSELRDFRWFSSLKLDHLLICRTSFDVFGPKGLIKFARDKLNTTCHLFDTYTLKGRDYDAMFLLPNVLVRYS